MYFPITIVDNFYNNFNKILKYVNTLEFYEKTQHTMPGTQTQDLKDLNSDLCKQAISKVLSVYYSRFTVETTGFECRTSFEKMIPYGEDYNKEGWIHTDDTNKLSGILYIQGDYNDGTSFYQNKNVGLFNNEKLKYKHALYSGESISPDLYNKNLLEHNSQFEEVLNIPCIPNRLVLFDSSMLHRSDGLGKIDKPRIIQTFFFGSILADSFPIPEIKRY